MNRADLACAFVCVAVAAVVGATEHLGEPTLESQRQMLTGAAVCTIAPDVRVRPVGLTDDR